jgi:hypothetical protein
MNNIFNLVKSMKANETLKIYVPENKYYDHLTYVCNQGSLQSVKVSGVFGDYAAAVILGVAKAVENDKNFVVFRKSVGGKLRMLA